jgi:hypothetical protein
VPLDCHFPFSAAIVLQLASLLHDDQHHADSINVLVSYLQKAGEHGNESAADCSRIVKEFGGVVARLQSQANHSQTSTLMELHAVHDQTGQTSNETYALQEEQSATYEELLSWFTEGLV